MPKSQFIYKDIPNAIHTIPTPNNTKLAIIDIEVGNTDSITSFITCKIYPNDIIGTKLPIPKNLF